MRICARPQAASLASGRLASAHAAGSRSNEAGWHGAGVCLQPPLCERLDVRLPCSVYNAAQLIARAARQETAEAIRGSSACDLQTFSSVLSSANGTCSIFRRTGCGVGSNGCCRLTGLRLGSTHYDRCELMSSRFLGASEQQIASNCLSPVNHGASGVRKSDNGFGCNAIGAGRRHGCHQRHHHDGHQGSCGQSQGEQSALCGLCMPAPHACDRPDLTAHDASASQRHAQQFTHLHLCVALACTEARAGNMLLLFWAQGNALQRLRR